MNYWLEIAEPMSNEGCMAIVTLFSSDELEVIYQDNDSHDLLIAFAAIDFSTKTDAFWGRYFAEKAGFAGLGFVARRNNWYPESHMKAAAEAVRTTIGGYRRAITYGSSMGAYAAVKYSRLLGATACAAFGPQFSIDPADGVIPTTYTRFFQPRLHSGMAIKAEDVCPQPFVFFDPQEGFDLEQVRSIIRVAPHTTPVALPFAGHECIKVVVYAGIQSTRDILFRCLQDDKVGVRAACRRLRAGSATRKAGIATALVARRPDLAFRLVEQARDRMDAKQLALFHDAAARSYIDKGAWRSAEDNARRAVAILPNRLVFIRTLATVFERTRRWTEALQEYAKCLDIEPGNASIHNAIAGIHVILCDLEQADAAIARAIAIAPARVDTLRRFASIRLAQGRPSDALVALTCAGAIDPADITIDFDLMKFWEQRGDRRAALESARSALRKNGRSPGAIAAVARLDMPPDEGRILTPTMEENPGDG
jgi:Flp pilus assembly protein TadD